MSLTDNNGFWYGKRVLVTGGDGLVAANLISRLLGLGAVVVATIRHQRPLSTLAMLQNGTPNQGNVPDIEMSNLFSYQEVRRICDRHQIDTIFHLAASAIVSDAANSPLSTAENNIIPTLNLLEVARVNKIPRVIIAATDKVYGEHGHKEVESLPYREHYALRGLDVYSATKACTDVLAQTFAFQFKIPVMIARCCNIYGPGDLNFTRLIPRTIMRLMDKKHPVINLGNENVLREYMYISDVVDAYLLLGEKVQEYYGESAKNMPKNGIEAYGWPAFNFASYTADESKNLDQCDAINSVKKVINFLNSQIENLPPQEIGRPENFIEIPDQFLEGSKMRKLGFKPKVSFEDGLKKTIEWYKSNYEHLAKLAAKYTK